MNSIDIQNQIMEYIEENSGLQQNRDYLGISKISNCPRRAFREYHNGPDLTPESHSMCYAGYEQEALILKILIAKGIAQNIPKEKKIIHSTIDPRFYGHIDDIHVDGSLLEIKSVNTKKFEKILQSGRALFPHFVQVQLYMRYGPFPRTFVIYRSRETYQDLVIDIPYNPNKALEFENKAKSLLQAIDSNKLPACECGYCHD